MANLSFTAEPGQMAAIMSRQQQRVARAAAAAMDAAVGVVKRDGRGAIRSAGLGNRAANALRVTVYGDKRRIDSAAFVHHAISYFGIFQTGATIKGSPLLWLPLSSAPLRTSGRRITAGNYEELIGAKLHIIRRPGKPPLLAADVARPVGGGRRVTVGQLRSGARRSRRAGANAAFGGRAGRFSTVSLPLFVGIPQAHIRRRFDLRGIYRRAQLTLLGTYLRELASGK